MNWIRCGADVSGRWWFELRKQLWFCAFHPVVENFMGLQPGIAYEYRITAAFSGGGVGHTNVLTFVTKSP